MRLIINCVGGGTHSLFVNQPFLVRDVKKFLESKEGVPVPQQVLLFAGQELQDAGDLFNDYQMDQYSLAHEVVVYMQRQLAEPRQVYLCSSDHQSQLHPELVESSSTLSNVMDLLQLRSLTAGPFHKEEDGSSSIVVKRQDGSSTRLVVGAGDSISDLESKISAAQQGTAPSTLLFYQAADGCLHVVFSPSQDAAPRTYPVYQRSTLPQPAMMVSRQSCHQRQI
eukprot:jgi/Chrzof1/13642/Cz08g05150.t1